jgi:hypothetical protein
VPSSSPMDAVMFNLAEMLGIVVGRDLYQWFLVSF